MSFTPSKEKKKKSRFSNIKLNKHLNAIKKSISEHTGEDASIEEELSHSHSPEIEALNRVLIIIMFL